MTVLLEVSKREGKGKATETVIPGVVYGPKQEPISLTVDRKIFEKVFAGAGESTIITLDGLGEEMEVLVQDVVFSPVKGGIRHIDFYAIERGKELTTNVPVVFENEETAEKVSGGVLTKALHEIEVTCRPSNIPAQIIVDISVLTELDATVRVKDLVLGEEVKIGNDAGDIIATIVAVKEEVIEEVEAPDMDSVEVEQKGKGEDQEVKAGDTPVE